MGQDDTIAALQALFGDIRVDSAAGAVALNAPLVLPAAIAQNMLPCALTFVGPMSGGKFPQTTYITLVLLAIVSQGINPEPIFSLGNLFLKAMRASIRQLGSLNGFPIEHGLHPTANGGTGSPYGMTHIQKYGGSEFYGGSFHVTLTEAP